MKVFKFNERGNITSLRGVQHMIYAEPPHVPYGNISLQFISPLRFLLRAATFHVMWRHLCNCTHGAQAKPEK